MIPPCAYRVPTPSNDTALVTVDRSRSGDLLLDDVKVDDRRGRVIQALRGVASAEEDLPRHQVREERGRRREKRVAGQKGLDVGPKRSSGSHFVTGTRRRKTQKVRKLSRDAALHPFERPRVNHH